MPTADAVLLPLCIGIALIGVLVVIVAGRRGKRGRVVQGLALTLAPVALYFAGLLRLVWDAVVAVVGWASRIVFSPTVWFGLSLLAVCVVAWVVGGVIARRTPRAEKAAGTTAAAAKPVTTGKASSTGKAKPAAKAAPPVDDDMAEIEALLKSRGIQ